MRTFPVVNFPAGLLLQREEIETGKRKGGSVITKVYHGKANKSYAWVEAPFDFMYGFRGSRYEVDLLSPYEMLLQWEMARIFAPHAIKCGDAR